MYGWMGIFVSPVYLFNLPCGQRGKSIMHNVIELQACRLSAQEESNEA